MAHDYAVTITRMSPRPVAAVRARLPVAEVPRRFATELGRVYAAARGGGIDLDGQNIFIYRDGADGQAEVDFGVGVRGAFDAAEQGVLATTTPAGVAATTTHWGDYAELGAAHEAVIRWCRARGETLTGVRWEVYGHWSAEPAARRTDVYYLLAADAPK